MMPSPQETPRTGAAGVSKRLDLIIDPDLYDRLEHISLLSGRSITDLVEEVLQQAFGDRTPEGG